MKVELSGDQCVWLPSDVDEREAESLLANDNYAVQTKEDGIHILAAKTAAGKVSTRNRRGDIHRVPEPLVKLIDAWPPETMIDGEKMHEGSFVAFDMLYASGEDLRSQPYDLRLLRLADFCDEVNSPLFRVVETALTTEAKRALVARIRAANGEGIILKDLRAMYVPGRTAWGWSMRRLKFVKRLTAILGREVKDTKAHFSVYLLERNGNELVPRCVGTVSAQQFYDGINPGAWRIGEIEYLYGTPSQRLVQPRLVRPVPWRDDKRPKDCTVDQIITGGRFATK